MIISLAILAKVGMASGTPIAYANILHMNTTFICMDFTYCSCRVRVDVISTLVTVLQSLDVTENTFLDHAN